MIGRKIISKDTVDSTNNYVAKLLLADELQHGSVILADNQVGGKGQRGAKWDSEPYKNINLSLFLKHANLSVKNNFYLTQAISLALLDFFNEIEPGFEIKWPNDIIFNSSKISGILIETHIEKENIKHSIIGIGINVNQEEFGAYNAKSLKLITGKEFAIRDLVFNLIEKLNFRVTQLESLNFEILSSNYLKNLWLFEKIANFKVLDSIFSGKIVGIDEVGRLLVQNVDSGEITSYQNKEIIFVDRISKR